MSVRRFLVDGALVIYPYDGDETRRDRRDPARVRVLAGVKYVRGETLL
jgi:hypothetical protein